MVLAFITMEAPSAMGTPVSSRGMPPLVRLVQWGLVAVGVCALLGGLILHHMLAWTLGWNWLMGQGIVVLNQRFLPPYGIRTHRGHLLIAVLKAAVIIFPVILGAQLAFLYFFPNWFPASCPLPPRH